MRHMVITCGQSVNRILISARSVYECPSLFMADSGSPTTPSDRQWPRVCYNPLTATIVVQSPQHKTCPTNGNPCVPATGAKEQHEADLEWSGLAFKRHYNSLGELPLASAMGQNWSHSLAHRLFAPSSGTGTIVWIDDRGHYDRLVWRSADSAYFAENSPGTVLRANVGDARWLLRREDGSELAFDSQGRLVRHGSDERALVLSYCTSADVAAGHCLELDLLLAAVDTRGRLLSFEYTRVDLPPKGGLSQFAVRLRSITDETGVRVRYGWDAQARLQSVEYPASTGTTSREYHYAESTHLCRLHNGAPEAGCDAAQLAQRFPNHLTGIVDENGIRTADYTYDSLGRVTQSQHAGNAKRVSLSYLSASQVRVTQPEGGGRLYTFSTGRFRKLLSSVEETTDGSVTGTTTHNVNTTTFRRNHTVDARGTRTNYTHDAFRETGRTEGLTAAGAATPLTRSTTSTWDNTLNRMLSRSEPGREIRLSYNPRGQVTARCEIDSAVPSAMAYAVCGSAANAPVGVRQSRYTYCEAADVAAANSTCPVLGALKSVDGPRTDVADITSYAYYASTDESGCSGSGPCYRKGDLHTVTNALGHVTTHARYDRAGRLTRSLDANGVATELVYHPRGWLLSRTVKGATVAEDASTTFAYAATGLVERITQADGSYLDYGYDDAHRLISVTDALGNRIDYTLDPAGNRTAETTFDPQNAVKRQLSRVYNQLGQLREQRDAQLRAYVSEYDANGNSTASTDPLNVRSTQSFDPLNRLQQSLQDVGGLNVSTGYRYDAQDRLTKVIDPKNLETNYTYNGLGDLTQLSSPDTGITSYTVDAAGNRLTQTDARGVTVTMQYDALNRLVQQSNSQDGELIVYQYDGAAGCSAGNFGLGRLSQIEDSMGTLSYCYDRRANVISKTRTRMTQGQPTPTLHWELGYRYSLADQLQAVIYPDGGEAQYSHDAAGRISSLSFRSSAAAPLQPVITQVDYAPFGPSVRLVYANGSEWTRELDSDYRIDSITAPGIGYDYSLDAVGNVIGLSQGAQQHAFEYDDLYRLTALNEGAVLSSTLEAFNYDATGNRLSASAGLSTQTYIYPTDSHRLQSVAGTARSYTAAGNTASLGNRNLQYSGFNRLSDISVGNVQPIQLQANTYSGRGEREQRRTGSLDRYFGYDEAGQLLFEAEQPLGKPFRFTTRYLWLGNQPVALVTGATAPAYPGELLHIHADHLGTPRAISRPTASNAVVWRWALEGSAFGQHPAQSDPDADGVELEFNLRYPGQYFDSATGWHYNYFRDYEPGTGRYVQSDPIGLEGDINTFRYTLNNPLIMLDPNGLQSWTCVRPMRGLPVVVAPSHRFLCTTRIDGTISCGGQGPSCGALQSLAGCPGTDGGEEFNSDQCRSIGDDKDPCFEECLLEKFGDKRPRYAAFGPHGVDCHEWANDTWYVCSKKCGSPVPLISWF
jgi:RHS repeat-associated protein